MILKRTIKVSLIVVLSFLFTGLTALSCFFLFIPRYVESEIIPSIAKDNGIEISSLKVRSIGFNGAVISDVRIGPDSDKSLQMDSIRVDYSISGLLDRKIDRIVLSGISGNLSYENNGLSIGGLDKFIKDQRSNSENNKETVPPNITIKNLLVTNSYLNLGINGKEFRIPFDFSATAFNEFFIPGKFVLRAYPKGNRIEIEGKNANRDKMGIAVSADKIALSCYQDFINEITPVDMNGQAGIDLTANLILKPFSITDISASIELSKTIIDYAGIVLKNPSTTAGDEQIIRINIKSPDTLHWKYDLAPVLSTYGDVEIDSILSGTADIDGGAVKSEMTVITRLKSDANIPVMRWGVSATRENSTGLIGVQINGKPDADSISEPFKASLPGVNITARAPELITLLEYENGALSGSYRFTLKKADAVSGEMSFSMPGVSVNGSIGQAVDKPDEHRSSFTVNSKEIVFNGFDVTAAIPDYLLKGTVKYNMEKGLIADARLIFKKGVMSMKNGLNVKGISGEIPVVWPFYGTENKGRLHVEGITYGKYFLGPIDMEIPQKGRKVSFTGSVKYPVLPDMTINLSGKASLDSAFSMADIRINVPAYQPSSSLDLGKLVTELKGYNFNGLVKSNAEIKISDSQLISGLNLDIESGKINNKEKKLTLDNISLNLSLEDLIRPRSPFGQKLKIGRISFGNIEASDFQVDFRVDSLTSLFIEQGKFKWCGGNIDIQAFRIDREKDEYLLTLFCDRLRLADILEQFGVKEVSGGGTVNGKIPVTISKGKIRFEDGFFYSTPGGGGKISIKGTDIFKTGMTPGSPAYTQADIASEALKAYDYSWVKMAVNSEKDELTVKLQFDGKPENQLPFRYDKSLNQFKRVEKGVPGANFQGISIDVNFRVPLDELLNYKGALDMINF